MNSLLRGAGAVAAAVALLAPAGASAMTASSARTYVLNTRLVERNEAGEIDGRLQLRITPDGIVQGTYRTDTSGFIAVTGGIDGARIWLDFGQQGRHHMEGTFENGKLVLGAGTGLDVWTLEGTPAA